MIAEINAWTHEVILANDTREDSEWEWTVEDGDTQEALLSGATRVPAGENAVVGAVSVDPTAQRLLVLRWRVRGANRNAPITS